MIRVALPVHLRTLVGVSREVTLQVDDPATVSSVLDVLENEYPVLRGTIRDHASKERRAFIRFFVCGEDWSLEPTDIPLPERIVSGKEPLRVIGAMAGG